MSSWRWDYFYVKPCKKVFSDRNLSPCMSTKFCEHINFLVKSQDCTFFKSRKTAKFHFILISRGKLPLTCILGISFRKASAPEKCGQDLKSTLFFKNKSKNLPFFSISTVDHWNQKKTKYSNYIRPDHFELKFDSEGLSAL